MNSVGIEFTCICGNAKGWVKEDEITLPCPSCGKKYKGKYNKDKLTIDYEVVSGGEGVILTGGFYGH